MMSSAFDSTAVGMARNAGLPLDGLKTAEVRLTPFRLTTNVASAAPSMNRPKLSCKPLGGVPWITTSTGFLSGKALFGVSVTWLSPASYIADASGRILAFLAVKDRFRPALMSW